VPGGEAMQLGTIGLGRIGSNVTFRLQGDECWIIHSADESMPAPVISEALFSYISSRAENEFAYKLLSARRYEFSGHDE
jgi:6-phosphogluconate dehydrogenase (decarboxylating)